MNTHTSKIERDRTLTDIIRNTIISDVHIHRTPILTNHTSSIINLNIGDRYIDIDCTYVESGDIHVSIFGENRCGAAAPEA